MSRHLMAKMRREAQEDDPWGWARVGSPEDKTDYSEMLGYSDLNKFMGEL